jgi:hypothetical protein
MPKPPPHSPDAFIESLVADLAPVAPLARGSGLTGVFIATLAAVCFAAFTFGLRPDIIAGKPGPVFLRSSGLFLLLACAASFAVVQISRPQVGNHQTGWIWALAMAALLPASGLLTWLAALLGGGQAGREQAAVDPAGWTCLAIAVVLGLGVAVILTRQLRRGAPTSPGRAGLLCGIAAGAAGVFALSMHCPNDGIVHIGLWHASAVALSAVAGRWIIPALVRW